MVVETRSLIFQLELRKPQETRCASGSQNFPSEGEISLDSQPCSLAACYLSSEICFVSTSVSSAIQLNTTSALMVALMLFNQRSACKRYHPSHTTKLPAYAQYLDHCLRTVYGDSVTCERCFGIREKRTSVLVLW